MTIRWSSLLIGTGLVDIVCEAAGRVGPIVGQAPRGEADRDALLRNFNGLLAERGNRTAGSQLNCQSADRQFAELERSLGDQTAPASSSIIGPSNQDLSGDRDRTGSRKRVEAVNTNRNNQRNIDLKYAKRITRTIMFM
jgi:hypothetical protein